MPRYLYPGQNVLDFNAVQASTPPASSQMTSQAVPLSSQASASAPTASQTSTSSDNTRASRVRLTDDDLHALVETCLEFGETYQDMPKMQWWADISVEFSKKTGKNFKSCQKRMETAVRDRRTYKKNITEGDTPSVTAFKRHLDEWIEVLDEVELARQDTSQKKQTAQQQEQWRIAAVQARSVRTLGKRKRKPKTSFNPSIDPRLQSLETGENIAATAATEDEGSEGDVEIVGEGARTRREASPSRSARSRRLRGKTSRRAAEEGLLDAMTRMAERDIASDDATERRIAAIESDLAATKASTAEILELVRALARRKEMGSP